jgi:hypothetical protein
LQSLPEQSKINATFSTASLDIGRESMAYDLHLVRTQNWLDAATAPITKADVDALIASDPELSWSTADYVEMPEEAGGTARFYMIQWNGESCFWWHKDQITCAGPNEAQQRKLVRMARVLNAHAIGDDGERYELRKNLFGRERLTTIAADI